MTKSEYIEATTRLEKYYEKELNLEQQKIMYDELKDIPVEKYKKAISICIRNNKYMPKIVDILNIIKDIKDFKKTTKEIIECDKCKGTGYVPYYKKIDNGGEFYDVMYMAVCSCGNASRYDGASCNYNKSKYYVPRIEEINL